MTNTQYDFAVSETANYTDCGAFVSDVALSSIWEDDESDEIPQERIAALVAIWNATHRSIKDIAGMRGLTVRELARHFAIPRRTMEDWSRGIYPPPTYTLLLMQEALGLLTVRRK